MSRHGKPGSPTIDERRAAGDRSSQERDTWPEQAESLRFERLIADASARFAGAWFEQIDALIELALKEVLDFTRGDQAGFFATVDQPGHLRLTHLNHAEGIAPAQKQVVAYDHLCPWLYDKVVNRGDLYFFNRLDELPDEAGIDRDYLRTAGTRSGLYIPYVVDDGVRHVFVVISNTVEMAWSPALIERLQSLGGVFVSALARKSVAEALRRSEAGLREAQRMARMGSWEWDPATDTLWSSPQIALILGARLGSMQDLLSRVPAEERDALAEAIAKSREGEPARQSLRHRILSASGEALIVESHFERRSDQAAAPRIFGILQDITQRWRDERELESLRTQRWHADRVAQIAVMTSSLAHELSQPLTAILSNAQAGLRLIRAGGLSEQDAEEILADIVADDKRAAQVIESLRAMLRRRASERQPVDAALLVRDVMALMRSELVLKDVQCALALPADGTDAGMVEGDRAQLQQVLINLILNGIEAMLDVPPGGRLLSLTLAADARGFMRFSLADVGYGLQLEDPSRVFEPFWTTRAGGLGMGLAICRSIVEAHGGRIWCENNAGPGATFSFTLPARTP